MSDEASLFRMGLDRMLRDKVELYQQESHLVRCVFDTYALLASSCHHFDRHYTSAHSLLAITEMKAI